MKRQQYGAIDVAKFICAIGILFYHYFSEIDVVTGLFENILSLYAIAVALFMALSGFLFAEKQQVISQERDQEKALWNQIKRIMSIYMIWSVPYLMYSISKWDFTIINVSFVVWKIQSWIFQSTFYTIWFMPSLAVGLILSFYSSKLFGEKSKVFAFCAYLIGTLMTTYSFVGKSMPGFSGFTQFANIWLQGGRGGIFFGFPLCVLGMEISKRETSKSYIFWMSMSVLSIFGLLSEALILKHCIGNTGIDLAIMIIPVSYCLINFLRTLPLVLSSVGLYLRKMSILVFMSQRMFLTVLPHFFPYTIVMDSGIGRVHTFLLCCGGTLIFSLAIVLLSKKCPVLKRLF